MFYSSFDPVSEHLQIRESKHWVFIETKHTPGVQKIIVDELKRTLRSPDACLFHIVPCSLEICVKLNGNSDFFLCSFFFVVVAVKAGDSRERQRWSTIWTGQILWGNENNLQNCGPFVPSSIIPLQCSLSSHYDQVDWTPFNLGYKAF